MSIEQNIENLEIRNANVVTFVGSSSTIVDTISGRIQCKGFQHNSNVITDISGPHGRIPPTLKKYPEIIFADGKFDRNDTTNTYVQAGYTVTDSSHHNEYYGAWIFDDQTGFVTNKNLWISPINTYTTSGGAGTPTMTTSDARCTTVSGVATPGEWVQLKLPNKVKLSSISIMGPTGNGGTGSQDLGRAPKDAVLAGSVDGTTWNSVLTWSGVQPYVLKTYKSFPANVDSTNYYNYFRLIVTKNDGTQVYASIQELQLYGTEEDPPAGDHSVDTTFKSRFNNPQLTGVQVFVDGKGSGSNQISGGPDVTGTTTYNESGKHWELNGQLTSNITMEANTFLEGDQPHAVSVWFNSSNLEANVSNSCIFSLATEEKLDSVNLDLQSNTWHNLTYAYQGEGGSRVTYLDGRKVSEDQAEDTFGDYPPFAMTGYSQGGYVVSASSTYSIDAVNWKPYKAFNDITNAASHLSEGGSSQNYYNDGSGGYTRSPPATIGVLASTGATINQGEFLKIEMPNKIVVDYISQISDSDRARDFKWYGSNDDYNWTQLLSVVDAPNTVNEESFVTTTKDAFKYFAIVVSKVYTTSTYQYFRLDNIKIYGHRENDLVRLPDPTNVLKYPHVVMTGPAQRGYVAKVSSQTSTTADYPHIIFDGDDTTQFRSALNTYTSGTANTTDNLKTQTSAGGTETINGSWISIELPHKLILQSTRVVSSDGTSHVPKRLIIYGSNDITNDGWVEVDTTYKSVDANIPYQGTGKTWTTTASSTGYKNFALAVSQIESSAENNRLVVSTWELYGTGVDSIPIQIGGGNIDKVANFRVYDKFIGEDQALEIWDAQKEEFGRAKPQMVLQQGKLGIGTDAPQGSLSVADEPDPTTYGLQEFPPRGMGGYKTYFEGHGEFCASASSELSPTYRAWDAFNHTGTSDTSDAWLTPMNRYTLNNYIDVNPSVAANINGVYGEWLELKLPYKITLDRFTIKTRAGSPYGQPGGAAAGNVWGSNDGVNWTLLTSFTGLTYGGVATTIGVQENVVVNSTTPYSHFRLQPTKRVGVSGTDGWVGFGELRYFGTREQLPPKQSVLHDGQLTLTKNLTVPRIGPALDADDTPRRDRLVVEYNTSTNPTFDGAVRDTSGRGNDALLIGSSAVYDANEKAFEFDGTDDYIFTGNIGNHAGAWVHSYSVWINLDDYTNENIVLIGRDASSNKASSLKVNSSTAIQWFFFGSDVTFPHSMTLGSWYHIACVYDGGAPDSSRRMWINGTELTISVPGAGTALNLDANAEMRIGRRQYNTATNNFNGQISNFKLYDTDLTASEVKTLYDMGRCDEGHHVVNFSKTRVGIGLGDGQAPRSALDVRDLIYARTTTIGTFTGQHICFPDESMEKGLIVSAKKNKFVKLNGLATGKSAITIDESLPIVSLSNVAQDKACFGVVSKMEESNAVYRKEITGGLVSETVKIAGDNRAIVNSVGEGAIWVVNTGGSLESGDYITTSNVAGYGQKQDGAGLMNYTVAKITMDCDFTASNVAVQTIKREETGLQTIMEDTWNQLVDYDRSSNTETQYSNTLVSSDYSGQSGYTPREVTTIMDYTDGSNLISTAEWSNLESNIQNTYQSNTFTEIVDYTKFVNLSEWSNLTAETQATYSEAEITTYYQIQRGENVLDENGQLQWEDKTGATEAPYERRFLAADGTQTDEANAVHIAAFVGCTYHCG
jgi:hypothetical protein